MMKKKWLALLMGAVMCFSVAGGLAACGDGGNYDYNITIWVGEGMDTLTKSMVEAFNEDETANPDGKKFKATVEIVSESKAASDAISKKESAADIFCFATDQMARLRYANMLQPLNSKSVAAIAANDDDSIAAATVGSSVYAFPMTSDNGYVMYYDKRDIPEEHVGSLEDIIHDCETANRGTATGKYFSMQLAEDGGWYAASFFYATGCQSEWPIDENGNFLQYTDTFDSPEGIIALQGMQKVLKSEWHRDNKEISAGDFSAKIPSAVLISGTWDYAEAKKVLGENLGIAPLPSFTVDGQSYQLKTYLGNKLMGINPHKASEDGGYKGYYLQQLAAYLTGYECQMQRLNEKGWGPSNKMAQQSEAAKTNELLSVFATEWQIGEETVKYAIPQGNYPTNWWTAVKIMAGDADGCDSDTASLQALLTTYAGKLNDFMGAAI